MEHNITPEGVTRLALSNMLMHVTAMWLWGTALNSRLFPGGLQADGFICICNGLVGAAQAQVADGAVAAQRAPHVIAQQWVSRQQHGPLLRGWNQ